MSVDQTPCYNHTLCYTEPRRYLATEVREGALAAAEAGRDRTGIGLAPTLEDFGTGFALKPLPTNAYVSSRFFSKRSCLAFWVSFRRDMNPFSIAPYHVGQMRRRERF